MSADPVLGSPDVELARRQMDDAFTAWCLDNQDLLYRFARWLGADIELAKDVLQDSLFKLWLIWPYRFEEITSNPGYARAVVRNMLYSHYRQRGRRPQTVGDLGAEPESPSDQEEPFSVRTRKALSRLEPRYQEVLFHIYAKGLKPHEAAVEMQIAAATAHTYHSLAKKAFKIEYEALAR